MSDDKVRDPGPGESNKEETEDEQTCDDIVVAENLGHRIASHTIAATSQFLMIQRVFREVVLPVIDRDIDLC